MPGAIASLRGIGAVAAVMAGVMALPNPLAAQSSNLQCGTFYRVKSGDTLRAVTLRAYQHDRFLELYDANRDVLVDPARIEIGQLLFLPCVGTGPQSRTAALTAQGVTPTPQDQLGTRQSGLAGRTNPFDQLVQIVSLPKPGSRTLRRGLGQDPATDETTRTTPTDTQIAAVAPTPRVVSKPAATSEVADLLLLSAQGMEPLAGPTLPSGGLIGELIQQALRIDAPARQIQTAFVNDRQAHLDVLLPLGGFAFGYPWPAPDCDGTVGKHTTALCTRFQVSLPIFQVEMRYLARADWQLVGAGTLQEIANQTVCRPGQFPPVDLERMKFQKVMVVDGLGQCLAALRSGEVDVISAPAPMMDKSDLGADIAEISTLRAQEPVHALFSRKLAGTPDLMRRLNSGLRVLQSSGAWFRTVSGYLSDFNSGKLARSN